MGSPGDLEGGNPPFKVRVYQVIRMLHPKIRRGKCHPCFQPGLGRPGSKKLVKLAPDTISGLTSWICGGMVPVLHGC